MLAIFVAKLIEIAIAQWKKRRSQVSVEDQIDLDHGVDLLLAELGAKMQASRTFVTRIHNGTYYIDGSEILKKSRTHEWTDAGVARVSVRYQNILTSHVPDEMKLVVSDGPGFSQVGSMPDSMFKRMLIGDGAESVARAAIRRNGKVVGFVGCDWNETTQPPENIDKMAEYAGRIERVMGDFRPKASWEREQGTSDYRRRE